MPSDYGLRLGLFTYLSILDQFSVLILSNRSFSGAISSYQQLLWVSMGIKYL